MPEPTDPVVPAAPPAVDPSKPGAGGWTPKEVQTVLASCIIGGFATMLDIADADLTLKRCLVAFAKGFVAAAMTYLGLKSAGIRKGV